MIEQWNALRAELALSQYQGLSDQAAATSLNAPTTVATASVPRDAFLLALRPAYLSLPGLTAAVQAKWDRILAAINTTTGPVTVDATTEALIATAVADGVLTQPQAAAVAALASAPSSRALQTFGVAVSAADVHAART